MNNTVPQNPANNNDLFFETVKEDRGQYFVEYHPPNRSLPFASLSLVFPDPPDNKVIAPAVETEVRTFLARYPVPIMAFSYDGAGASIDLELGSYLFGWTKEGNKEHHLHWGDTVTCRIPPKSHGRLILDQNIS